MNYHPDQIIDFPVDTLSIGQTERFHCENELCDHKPDKTLTVTRTTEGLLYNCYRCETRGMYRQGSSPKEASSLIRRLRNERHTKNFDDSYNPSLPTDFVALGFNYPSIPVVAYAWLYQYNLEHSDLVEFNIGYSRKLRMIIFPFYEGDDLIGYQGRSPFVKKGDKEGLRYYTEFSKEYYLKYLKDKYSKDKLKDIVNLENKIRIKYIIESKDINNSCTVFTEDIISAIKVNKATNYQTIAILGNDINEYHLLTAKHNIYIWLDDDMYIKSLKQSKWLQKRGYNSKVIHTVKDPKYYSLKEIRNYAN